MDKANMSAPAPSQYLPPFDTALLGVGISKTFSVSSEGETWRIILGRDTSSGKKISALQDISITIPKGEIAGVLGRNGAGKSTLLRTLGGIYQPTSGFIKINGDLSGLFELGGGGSPYLTGREFSARALSLHQVEKKNIRALIEGILDFSELGDYFDRPIYTYSAGMAARLYFSIATAVPHSVYLIDEVLSVGDEHFQGKCWRRMRDLLACGASGILVTHDWAAVIKLCKQAHILDRGKIVFSGASDVTVARYLNLPMPKRSLAAFAHDMPKNFSAESSEDTSFYFDIEIFQSKPISFGCSIELLRLGVGWEIVLMSDPVEVTSATGKSLIHVRIPKLPIAPGEYSLNLFLTDAEGQVVDVRSWTYGNALHLKVNGEQRLAAIAQLDIQWSVSHG
jgi:lipopolysaccharide transport system ATP-binding protein